MVQVIMVLSNETSFKSDVDLLIPVEISGLGQDILAETWNVEEMLACNLLKPVARLSRKIYDILLNVGDYYHGLVDQPPDIREIESSGLKVGTRKASQDLSMKAFHAQELAWNDVLSIPVAAYRTYLKAINAAESLLNLRITHYP